jgi:hypothetical protein
MRVSQDTRMTIRGPSEARFGFADPSEFDFISHQLGIRASDGRLAGYSLEPQSVATLSMRCEDSISTSTSPGNLTRFPTRPASIRTNLTRRKLASMPVDSGEPGSGRPDCEAVACWLPRQTQSRTAVCGVPSLTLSPAFRGAALPTPWRYSQPAGFRHSRGVLG